MGPTKFRGKFEVGIQPCDNYRPQDDLGYGLGNEHSCLAPFDGTYPCEATVSFCDNCSKDHHADGYDSCKGRMKKESAMKTTMGKLKLLIKEEISVPPTVTTSFDSLVGKTVDFYGVDNTTFCVGIEGKRMAFEAIEDEGDGYRSYLDTIESKPEAGIYFRMPLAKVKIKRDENLSNVNIIGADGYRLVDIKDGHVWLKIGTANSDDYYPSFVFEYEPKAPIRR